MRELFYKWETTDGWEGTTNVRKEEFEKTLREGVRIKSFQEVRAKDERED